jgi:transketolase
MRAAIEVQGPVYFRIARLAMPPIFGADHTFEWGRGVVLQEGLDVTLLGTGIMTTFCLKAANLLAQENISAEVVHLASIKPIDRDLIVTSVAHTGCAVTAENATINGGFGSAVMEVLGEERPVPIQRIGVRDCWVDSGGVRELFTHHGMQPEDIATAAKQVIQHKIGFQI